jgi:hypothetical protein
MRTRSACRCLLCQLEVHLGQQLHELGHAKSYCEVAQSSLLLSGFPNAFALTAHLRSCRSNGSGSHPADAVLFELFQLRQKLKTDALLRDILLLAFIPVLHATSRQIAKQYPSVPSDDAAQHLVATFLEALDSNLLHGRNSHLAFVLSRMVRRNVFDWAKRECRIPGSAERDDPLPEPASALGIPESLESAALLRHFLFRCERQGLLSEADLELLVHIKLQASRSEAGQTSLVYSNALRQKMKRLLRKLRHAARSPSTAVPQRAPVEPA